MFKFNNDFLKLPTLDGLSNQLQFKNDNNFKSDYNFGKCKVCKSKATGVHYGAPTCEGCKGFFKRSIDKHQNYACFFENKCVITPNQRRCKFCRWKACTEAGMSLEGIKMGRISKIEKERNKKQTGDTSSDESDEDTVESKMSQKIEKFDNRESIKILEALNKFLNIEPTTDLFLPFNPSEIVPKTNFTESLVNNSNEDFLFLISLVKNKCYEVFMDLSEDKRKSYNDIKKLIQTNIEKLDKHILNQSEKTMEEIWDIYCEEITFYTQKFVNMLDLLPGLGKFSVEDKFIIINEHFFSIYGLIITKLFINGELYLILKNDFQISRQILGKFIDSKSLDSIFTYHAYLNSLQLTDYEVAILVPLILCYIDLEVSNKELLEELRFFYSKVLLYELDLNNRSSEFYNQLIQMVSYGTVLGKICKQATFQASSNL